MPHIVPIREESHWSTTGGGVGGGGGVRVGGVATCFSFLCEFLRSGEKKKKLTVSKVTQVAFLKLDVFSIRNAEGRASTVCVEVLSLKIYTAACKMK